MDHRTMAAVKQAALGTGILGATGVALFVTLNVPMGLATTGTYFAGAMLMGVSVIGLSMVSAGISKLVDIATIKHATPVQRGPDSYWAPAYPIPTSKPGNTESNEIHRPTNQDQALVEKEEIISSPKLVERDRG